MLNFLFVAEETPIHDPAGPKGNIFVAYAREDERAVERLRTELGRCVNVTWHSHLKFPGLAAERPQGVADAVRDCDIFLSVFSRATAARGDDYSWLELIWVEMWKKTSPEGRHYVAVLIDDSPEPARREAHSFPDVKYIRLPEGEVSPEFGAQIRGLLEEAHVTEEGKHETRMAPPVEAAPISPPPVLSIPVMEPKAPEKPLVHDENVQFTVYRPKTIIPEKWHTMLAFAHLSEKAPDASPDDPDPVEEVARQARQILGQAADYGQTTQDSSQAIPRDGEITMVPVVQGIAFNPPRRTFLWTEAVHREEFRLRAASPGLEPKTVLRGRLTLYLGTLIIAEIPLKFQVEFEASSVPAQNMATAQARPYRKIFASYSHQDTAIVEHIEHYANAVGDTYLRDALNLRAGQDWNDELLRMIDQADIFQLFWSSNSMRSKYCRQEWEYALGLNRSSFIRPTYWEDPLPSLPHESLPPPELSRLHFQRIMSSRLPIAPSTFAPEPVSPAPPCVRANDEVRGVGASSTSVEEKLMAAKSSSPKAAPAQRNYAKTGAQSAAPSDFQSMSPAPCAPAPRRPSGGRSYKKIALLACVAVLAVGAGGIEYMRQQTMVAASDSFFHNINRQPGAMPLTPPPLTAQQETASAQTSADANSRNAPAAGSFDASPPPQTAAAATQQNQPPAAAAMPASPPVIAPAEPAGPAAVPPTPPPQQ